MKTDESRLNRMMSKKLLHLSSTIPSVLITPQQHHSFSAHYTSTAPFLQCSLHLNSTFPSVLITPQQHHSFSAHYTSTAPFLQCSETLLVGRQEGHPARKRLMIDLLVVMI